MQAQLSFLPTPQTPERGELIFDLTVPGRLPSWNEILGMEQWARYKFKGELADSFLSALKASAGDCSTSTIFVKSTMSIYAVTLECYLRMRREQRALKSAKKKSALKKLKGSKSKSSPSNEKVPF